MSSYLQNNFTFTDEALRSLGVEPNIQIGMSPYKEGFPVPCQGDLVQVAINGKSRQFVVVLRQFIYQSAEEMSIRYVLDTIR
jgi:hypothetical protein